MNEFKRWCPMIRAFKFHGGDAQRADRRAPAAREVDVCVTSYEMAIKEKNALKKFHWRYIIDEATASKRKPRLSKTMRMFACNNCLLITGTPLQNNLHELWALLNFLLRRCFPAAPAAGGGLAPARRRRQREVVQQLHKVLRFPLRRLKARWRSRSPEEGDDPEGGHVRDAEGVLQEGSAEGHRGWNSGGDRSRLLNMVMQLRKCCNHPYLFQAPSPPPYFAGEHLIENSGKLVLLDKLLNRLKEKGSRVFIFSQMTRLLDILEDYMIYRRHKYCRIDGNTSGDDREDMIDPYNAPGSEKFVFLLSTRAGGLGINPGPRTR